MPQRPTQLTMPVSAHGHALLAGIALFLLAGIGAARIVSTYHVFSQTTDEPAHLATGMEWLERGTYTLEPLHPPLARVAVALGPYLSGLRLVGQEDVWKEGNGMLLTRGRYLHNLALARLGALPFFLFGAVAVWYWGRTRYGHSAALVAALLFTTSPVVLAHAGLATTDTAAAATVTGAFLAFLTWLGRPTYAGAALLGIAVALAILSKFSALVFLPAGTAALWIWRWLLGRNKTKGVVVTDHFPWARSLLLVALVACVMVWAGYRFSLGSFTNREARPHAKIDRLLGRQGTLHNLAYTVAESSWFPATAFFRGLDRARWKEARGHTGYLLGQVRENGWWYFFPVALAVKTTLGSLLLAGVGVFCLVEQTRRERNWTLAAPLVCALALLLVSMPSHINIGVRHILPIYPLLAIMGGVGASWLWKRAQHRYWGRAVVLALLAWHLVASIRAHPDYLPYFNELAGQHPERILIDSDLDWGQDLLRLSAVLKQRQVEEVSMAYAGSAELDLSQFGLPPFRTLAPHERAAGWIAISLLRLKAGGLGFPYDSFSWLEAYQPVCLVGRSIRLYNVPGAAQGKTEQPISESGATKLGVPNRRARAPYRQVSRAHGQLEARQ